MRRKPVACNAQAVSRASAASGARSVSASAAATRSSCWHNHPRQREPSRHRDPRTLDARQVHCRTRDPHGHSVIHIVRTPTQLAYILFRGLRDLPFAGSGPDPRTGDLYDLDHDATSNRVADGHCTIDVTLVAAVGLPPAGTSSLRRNAHRTTLTALCDDIRLGITSPNHAFACGISRHLGSDYIAIVKQDAHADNHAGSNGDAYPTHQSHRFSSAP